MVFQCGCAVFHFNYQIQKCQMPHIFVSTWCCQFFKNVQPSLRVLRGASLRPGCADLLAVYGALSLGPSFASAHLLWWNGRPRGPALMSHSIFNLVVCDHIESPSYLSGSPTVRDWQILSPSGGLPLHFLTVSLIKQIWRCDEIQHHFSFLHLVLCPR